MTTGLVILDRNLKIEMRKKNCFKKNSKRNEIKRKERNGNSLNSSSNDDFNILTILSVYVCVCVFLNRKAKMDNDR